MSSKSRPRFDPHTLKALAGGKAFLRGEAYFRDGLVDVLGIEPSRVLARVAGSEDYRTIVTGQATVIGGECSCPAFEREGLCKHMVAVALAANKADGSGEAESGGPLARLRNYLKSKDVDSLVEMIMDMAERDGVLLRRLEIGAATIDANDKALESQLRKVINDATRIRGFVDYERAEWTPR